MYLNTKYLNTAHLCIYAVLTLTYTGARMGKNLRKYATAI